MLEKMAAEKPPETVVASARPKNVKATTVKAKVATKKVTEVPPEKESSPAKEKLAKAVAPKPAKSVKPVKQKMVRDSFTMPENDYANLGLLKARCLGKGVEVKKSEIVRAGLIALNKMTDADLLKLLGEVERLKTGRPKGK